MGNDFLHGLGVGVQEGREETEEESVHSSKLILSRAPDFTVSVCDLILFPHYTQHMLLIPLSPRPPECDGPRAQSEGSTVTDQRQNSSSDCF
ncbi:hypothetical protein Q7C36_021664 [Tachysurus vachellii]|uniref:Uncharacterized protein n=1 Tax=Tachysurus vachellii TaxID=175792 RepID=A0AA88LPB1_TACVA|nr:hypothetical protein Q7C36_021664 [Tachysurus vachellii]